MSGFRTGGTGSGGSTTANQGTPNTLANGWPVKVTDGTNVQPTGDTPARSIDVEVTDGTNVLGVSGHPLRVDPTGTTSQPVTVSGTVAVTESGTWNVGLNAGTNLIGIVSASAETSTIYNGTTALTPSFAQLTQGSSGDTSVIAAVSSKHIRVLSIMAVAAAAVNIFFRDGAAGTQLSGTAYLAANGGFVLPFNPVGWFQTSVTTALYVNLSGAQNVGITVVYVAV